MRSTMRRRDFISIAALSPRRWANASCCCRSKQRRRRWRADFRAIRNRYPVAVFPGLLSPDFFAIPVASPLHFEGTLMTTEDDVLAALDKPRALYPLQQRLDPSSKSTEALQELLMRMRAAGSVKFDIKTGKWSKAK